MRALDRRLPWLVAAFALLGVHGCGDLDRLLAPEGVDGMVMSMDAPTIHELSVLRAPGPDGILFTGDDIFTSSWPTTFMGWANPPGDLWHALGVDLAPVDGGVQLTAQGSCLGSQRATPFNNWSGGVGITFLDPATGTPATAAHVSVEISSWNPVTLKAFDADNALLGTRVSSTTAAWLTLSVAGIERVEVTGSVWCIAHRIRYTLESAQSASEPVADAGEDQVVEATGYPGTTVTLDGSASSDADGDIVSWEWLDDDGAVIATGETAQVGLPLGVHTITLRVTASSGLTAEAEVQVTVQDTTPPDVDVVASPDILWPANGHYHTIALVIDATDIASDDLDLVLLAEVVSSEPENGGDKNGPKAGGDIRVTRADGTVVLSSGAAPVVSFDPRTDHLELRADRAPAGPGRVYTIAVRATDPSGNEGAATATVTVPQNPGRGGR